MKLKRAAFELSLRKDMIWVWVAVGWLDII
jgi:hypothetical protein